MTTDTDTDILLSEYRQLLEELTESRHPASRENRAARDIATRWHKRLQGDRIAASQGTALEYITVTGIVLEWGRNQRDGNVHTEWHAPCGCAWHPSPAPHWHPCDQHQPRPALAEVLDEIEEYLDRHQDVLDGEDNRPRPNMAMSLLTRLREARR